MGRLNPLEDPSMSLPCVCGTTETCTQSGGCPRGDYLPYTILSYPDTAACVPVPRVRRYGRSGNCAYILSDYVAGDGFYDVRLLAKTVPVWIIAARLEKSAFPAVERLQLLDISHNDLHYNNIIMDRYWRIAAVIDWDLAW
ncbi:hypothetical protein EXIGLDRAFT_431227 [Exidia glandulosa HHB12029]|uniref:Aminoglycoside phosphotransferase domain-containing protein n=1 Tax=Exidia glandulosa HHB12029 TaxID=1314781 RepID=A0A165BAH1_EXIGL|nr:hypothetical protein EXIGLDRAFT_431227 [Exidia glandulosa HHB12029]